MFWSKEYCRKVASPFTWQTEPASPWQQIDLNRSSFNQLPTHLLATQLLTHRWWQGNAGEGVARTNTPTASSSSYFPTQPTRFTWSTLVSWTAEAPSTPSNLARLCFQFSSGAYKSTTGNRGGSVHAIANRRSLLLHHHPRLKYPNTMDDIRCLDY